MKNVNIDHYPASVLVEMLDNKATSSILDIGFNGEGIHKFAF